MVLDPIPQLLPVHFFGSRPQPPTSHQEQLCKGTTRPWRVNLWQGVEGEKGEGGGARGEGQGVSSSPLLPHAFLAHLHSSRQVNIWREDCRWVRKARGRRVHWWGEKWGRGREGGSVRREGAVTFGAKSVDVRWGCAEGELGDGAEWAKHTLFNLVYAPMRHKSAINSDELVATVLVCLCVCVCVCVCVFEREREREKERGRGRMRERGRKIHVWVMILVIYILYDFMIQFLWWVLLISIIILLYYHYTYYCIIIM